MRRPDAFNDLLRVDGGEPELSAIPNVAKIPVVTDSPFDASPLSGLNCASMTPVVNNTSEMSCARLNLLPSKPAEKIAVVSNFV